MEEVAHASPCRSTGACVNISRGEADGGFRQCNVPDTFLGMPWPKTVPDDLRRKLEAVLGYRNRPAPQDVWGAVLEWLEMNGVRPPSVRTDREP
jgi:hypothetical protein